MVRAVGVGSPACAQAAGTSALGQRCTRGGAYPLSTPSHPRTPPLPCRLRSMALTLLCLLFLLGIVLSCSTLRTKAYPRFEEQVPNSGAIEKLG